MLLKGREISKIEAYVEELDLFVEILAYYIGDTLIWENVKSCYGAGYWINEKPWTNDEGWKNEASN